MKITEVARPSFKRLVEEIDKNNNTGFLSEDIARIIEADMSGCWSQPQTADELIAEMDAWDAEYDSSNSIS